MVELCDLTDHFQLLLFQPGLSRKLPYRPATRHSLCNFSPVHVSSREVRQLLRDLDPSKAAGLDEIPPVALKKVEDEIPDEFKIRHRHPLLKSGKTNSKEASNYRGITLTYVLSKVQEKVIRRHICQHLESSRALSTSQF